MKNIRKSAFLFGVSCILMGLIVAPFAFFYVRSIDPVELDTFQAEEEFATEGTADYVTYRTEDPDISCLDQEGKERAIFEGNDADVAFTNKDFLHVRDITCSSEITSYREPSPRALQLTTGLLIAAPVFLGVGVWITMRNRKPKAN